MVRRIPLLLPVALLLASCDDHPAPTKAQPTPAQQAPVPDEIEEPPPPPPPTEQPEDVVEEVLIVESEAAPEAKKESAFDSNQWNSAVGAGGGAGGAFGGRSGRRRAMRLDGGDAESYAEVDASGYLTPEASPLSTFAADVDTASFTNAHRILRDGERPPTAAIRVEEFVNACRYDLPTPTGRTTFAIESEVAACPWNAERELVRFSLSTRAIDKDKLPPCNFVFLIDVSGSMRKADKLPLLQKASDLLIDQLRPQDTVSIVTYANSVRVPLDSISGSEPGKIREAIQALRTSGGTNGQGGIQAAYELATKNKVQGVNRVLLATDGDFNVGIRDADELEEFIKARKEQGVFLTVLGFGTGNLKDDRLERLANRGNGNYHYVDNLHTARRVLVEEFGAEMMTVAKDVKLQAEFHQGLVKRYRLLGYENRALAARDFRDDKKDGGEMGAGHDVTALYEIERVADAEAGEAPLATLRVRYKPAEGDTSKEIAHELPAPAGKPPALSKNGHVAATAAAVAMQLRDDEHRGSITPDLLAELAQGLDADRNQELIALVQQACKVLAEPAEGAGGQR
jgi:Ca-activated chloride channel family protein